MLPTSPLKAISDRHLDKEALIESPSGGGTNEYGQPQRGWTQEASGVPCRLAPASQMEGTEQTVAAQTDARQRWVIVFKKGTQVKPSWRITIGAGTAQERQFEVEGSTYGRSYAAMTKVTAVEYTD